MQRIRIYEKDNTSNNVTSTTSRGAILIPGFSKSTATDVGTAVECRSLNEFITAFGKDCPKFVGEENYYPYAENPTPAISIAKGKSLETEFYATFDETETTHFKLRKSSGSLEYAKYFSTATDYSYKDQCIYNITDATTGLTVTKVLKCSNKDGVPAGKEFNAGDWNVFESKANAEAIIKLESDTYEKYKDKITYYELNIDVTHEIVEGKEIIYAEANFVFLRVHDDPGFSKAAIPVDNDGSDVNYSLIKMFEKDTYDPSWLMAYSYLALGMPVVYTRMNKVVDDKSPDYDVTPRRAYEFMKEFFNVTATSDLLDKGAYNIQFVTSGGYPTLEFDGDSITKLMRAFAMPPEDLTSDTFGRGDCLVLIDHTNNPYRPLIGEGSVFESGGIEASKYAAVYTPWCEVNLSNLTYVPGSFIYLYNIASKLATNNSWNIYAGIGNGRSSIIKRLNTNKILTNKIAEYYLNDYSTAEHNSINAITYIRNYGYCIWGNRTCEKYQAGDPGFATSFVNIRNLVSEVKKRAYFVSQLLMFEVNDDNLWAKFRSNMSTLLDTMKNGNGLEDYAFIKNTTEDKTKLSVAIILYPTYGVESVEVNIRLEDNATIVEES